MKHNRNNEHKHEIHQRRNLNQQTDEKAKRVGAKEAKWVQTRKFYVLESCLYFQLFICDHGVESESGIGQISTTKPSNL